MKITGENPRVRINMVVEGELARARQLEPIEELYPLEPMIEPYELDLIGDIEPLTEKGVEVL